jgi:hypothetical protein
MVADEQSGLSKLSSVRRLPVAPKGVPRRRLQHYVEVDIVLGELLAWTAETIRSAASVAPKGVPSEAETSGAPIGVNRSDIPRKEVIQPQLPLRLPCYDFTPIIDPTFDGCLLRRG